jgi:hypothetical protein
MRINRRENEGGDHPQLSNTVQFSDGNTKKFPTDPARATDPNNIRYGATGTT